MRKTKKPRVWIAVYSCGCTEEGPRRELLEYCGTHGGDRKEMYPLPTKQERQMSGDEKDE